MERKPKSPYLERNKFGVWEIRWSENRRSLRRTTGARDFQEAQKILANFILLKDRDEVLSRNTHDITVLEVLGDPDNPADGTYWAEHVLKRVESKETATFAAKKILAYFGPMAVKDIMPDHVRAFIAKRRSGEIGKPSIDATIERDLSVLRAAINHAACNKRLPVSDVPYIEKLRGSPPKDRWLSKAEANKLLSVARMSWDKSLPLGEQQWAVMPKLPRVYKFIAIALATGSRKSAILELKRDQVDLEWGMIQFNPSGRRQTKKRRPAVPISDELMPVMKQIIAEAEGDLLLGSGCIRTAFEGACSRAGLHDVTPHTLRHTWATWAAQAGVPLTDIAAVLGDTYATVERNYLHHCPEHLRGAVNAVRRAA